MTEEEWLSCIDPLLMLQWLTPGRTAGRACDRTSLLFGLACVERVVGFRGNAETWVLRRAEEHADGIPDAEPHITSAHVYELQRNHHPLNWALLMLLEPDSLMNPYQIAENTAEVASSRPQPPRGTSPQSRMAAEYQAQAAILRDIIGNPFRPVTFDPAWRTSDVMLLAQGIYDERAFDRMPILADALQDAGCTSEDILSHCRDTSLTHVRGCWVVDLVLGKQ